MSEQSESSARVCRRNVVGRIAVALVATALGAGSPAAGHAAEVEVRHQEGVTRGFLVVRTSAGDIVAEGDLLTSDASGQATLNCASSSLDGWSTWRQTVS